MNDDDSQLAVHTSNFMQPWALSFNLKAQGFRHGPFPSILSWIKDYGVSCLTL